MKSPEEIKAGLEDGFSQVISRETEGMFELEHFFDESEALINSILDYLFGKEEDVDEMEELHPDMDFFTEE